LGTRQILSSCNISAQLDTEGWWSVTPEVLAAHQSCTCASLCGGGGARIAVDAMAGCGGNAIAMASHFSAVYGVELSARRAAMCAHNAAVYGVTGKVEVVCTDFFTLAPTLVADVIFVSPPWGGPKYKW
jgi:trimethylguanosine synthase